MPVFWVDEERPGWLREVWASIVGIFAILVGAIIVFVGLVALGAILPLTSVGFWGNALEGVLWVFIIVLVVGIGRHFGHGILEIIEDLRDDG